MKNTKTTSTTQSQTYRWGVEYEYNSDNTIKNYNGENVLGVKIPPFNYSYSNGKVAEINSSASLYKNKFVYDATGKMTSMIDEYKDLNRTVRRLEYTYTNGLVSTLKYYQVNDDNISTLTYTTTYRYDSNNQLIEITSVNNTNTDTNNNRIIWTIGAYSDEMDFNPWWFCSPVFGEGYELLNFPVLNQLKNKLPKRITETRFRNGQAYVSATTDINYTITNGRLDKQVAVIQYPEYPQSNTTTETLYAY